MVNYHKSALEEERESHSQKSSFQQWLCSVELDRTCDEQLGVSGAGAPAVRPQHVEVRVEEKARESACSRCTQDAYPRVQPAEEQ